MSTEKQKEAAKAAVARTHAAWSEARRRLALSKRPTSVVNAQLAMQEAEAAYRRAARHRDQVFGLPPDAGTPVMPSVAKELRKSRRDAKRARRHVAELLDMLAEWDPGEDGMSGFAGFYAVNRAERFLGRTESTPQ